MEPVGILHLLPVAILDSLWVSFILILSLNIPILYANPSDYCGLLGYTDDIDRNDIELIIE